MTNGGPTTAATKDDARVAFYRQQLLLAVQGKLSDSVRATIEELVAEESDNGDQ